MSMGIGKMAVDKKEKRTESPVGKLLSQMELAAIQSHEVRVRVKRIRMSLCGSFPEPPKNETAKSPADGLIDDATSQVERILCAIAETCEHLTSIENVF